MFHEIKGRIRTAILAVWYALVHNSFSIGHGYIYIPGYLSRNSESNDIVTRIPLKEK